MDLDAKALLKTLGKQAKEEASVRTEQEKKAARQLEEDVDFKKAMQDAKPLKNQNRYIEPRDTSPIKPRKQHDTGLEEQDYFYVGEGQWQNIPAVFSKNGRGQQDIKRLQRGEYPVVADVDLHGYTQEEAQQVLNEFIEFTQQRGVCGEIIHGSGLGSSGYQPVLKNLVRRWLMQHPDVLAYVEPHKNNDGAVRILLKRKWQCGAGDKKK
ncbi:MAG: Smr/MutS family protein [Neisseria sp.]|uniref:Smr/MutS family protein n=1 Tax=Neisseria sp. TaxID=192066 RepID=UPI0026DADAE3|nr:Smr/MutS family protein [Neisseria sp.]MDO4641202.1 Smr/MutS family protein [Neisseria sp.]